MSPVPFSRVSAFTTIYNSGNPAGVVILPSNAPDNELYMSSIAVEMNMAETAYVRSINNVVNEYSIRWYCAPSGHEGKYND